ncbi:hypothetical protein GH741_01685 [Aquibacillus halophilus]|uniref:Uncharacterized protein n=1 Tax=Aquibacillus halophilus TaxID=930132 RepID=A0A6A8DJ82_9BACI|nr:hypothetical protein [Aquibacillus halophilus]MRH41382.1 hypothetical protein [Aquibacillus halophilus]
MENQKLKKLKTFKRVAWYLMLLFIVSLLVLKNFELNELANIPYVLTAIAGISVIVSNLLITKELRK